MTKHDADAVVDRIARAWASIDGKVEAFERERDNPMSYDDPAFTGHYMGYMEEAKELLEPAAIQPGDDLGNGLVAVQREPTWAMYEAGRTASSFWEESTPDKVYRAMIAASGD